MPDSSLHQLEQDPELRELGRRLDRARSTRDQDLAFGRTLGEDELLERFREFARSNPAERLAVTPSPRAPWYRWPLWLGGIAAAGLLALTLWKSFSTDAPVSADTDVATTGVLDPDTPATLGAADLECVLPTGPVERYSEFRWNGRLSPGESYDLSIFLADDAQAGALVTLEDLFDSSIRLTDEQVTLLGRRAIRWTIRVRGADGRLTDTVAEAEASRTD